MIASSTIRNILHQAQQQLADISSSSRLDAELLLMYILKKPRSWLYAHDDFSLQPEHQQQFQQVLAKRLKGIPLAYLTGQKEFWSLNFTVNCHTLIPRPETELLIELCLQKLEDLEQANVLELGFGSGAISIALGHERPKWRIQAVDICAEALDLAKENAQHLGVFNVQFDQSDWFSAINNQTFDAIISNPPYLAMDDPHLLSEDIQYEPRQALISGKEGLDAIQHIIAHSPEFLKPGGWLLLEHGFQQKKAISDLFKKYCYKHPYCWQDMAGLDRVSGAQYSF